MPNTRTLLAVPLAALALALAACSPPEESPPMDPADNAAPAEDPWTAPETGDPVRIEPVDPQETPPEDRPPSFEQPPTVIEPVTDPTEDEVQPPEPEDAGDPVDP